MTTKFLNSVSGAEFVFEPLGPHLEAHPLGFKSLCEALRKNNFHTTVTIDNLIVREYPDLSRSIKNAQLTLNWNTSVNIFTLMPGGWLPPRLSRGLVVFPDRNILTHLKKSEDMPQGFHSRSLNEAWQSIKCVDPLLCALEGRKMAPPSFFKFRAELTRCARQLKKAWPELQVLKRTVKQIRKIYFHILILQSCKRKSHSDFLSDCQLLMPEKHPAKNQKILLENVFNLAEKHRVSTVSLTFRTVLSLIYAGGNNPNFAEKVLKFYEKNYSKETAYNAFCDISALELLLKMPLITTDYYCFMTGDFGAALLWCALEVPTNSILNNNPRRPIFELGEHLLPMLSFEERQDLAKRCVKALKNNKNHATNLRYYY